MSAQAAVELLSNPHGLDVQALTTGGIENWDWTADALEIAYDKGEVVGVTAPIFPIYGAMRQNLT